LLSHDNASSSAWNKYENVGYYRQEEFEDTKKVFRIRKYVHGKLLEQNGQDFLKCSLC
jgi:hypothetical protein